MQAVRKLDTDVVRLKAAAAVAPQAATAQAEESKVAHDKQVAALKLANDVLQQQLAQMAESVPAMLRQACSDLPKLLKSNIYVAE